MNYEIRTIDNISCVLFLSPPSVDDIKNAISDLAPTQPRLRLWDLSCGMDLSSNELKEVAKFGKSNFNQPAKVAIVAPADLAYGLSRMYEVYREDSVIHGRAFRNQEEALQWLKES